MGWILKLLGGSGGIWFLIGGLAAAGVAGAGGGYLARGVIDAPQLAQLRTDVATAKGETTTCQRDREHDLAVGNAKVTAELQASIAKLTGIIGDLEKEKQARDAATAKYMEALSHVPKTSICGGSAAELVYRNSVQPAHRPAVP